MLGRQTHEVYPRICRLGKLLVYMFTKYHRMFRSSDHRRFIFFFGVENKLNLAQYIGRDGHLISVNLTAAQIGVGVVAKL